MSPSETGWSWRRSVRRLDRRPESGAVIVVQHGHRLLEDQQLVVIQMTRHPQHRSRTRVRLPGPREVGSSLFPPVLRPAVAVEVSQVGRLHPPLLDQRIEKGSVDDAPSSTLERCRRHLATLEDPTQRDRGDTETSRCLLRSQPGVILRHGRERSEEGSAMTSGRVELSPGRRLRLHPYVQTWRG